MNFFRQHSTHFTWGIEITSGRLLSPYMENYKLGDGAIPSAFFSSFDVGWVFKWGEYVDIYLASTSNRAYQYYEALIKQFYNDGGAFSQACFTAHQCE